MTPLPNRLPRWPIAAIPAALLAANLARSLVLAQATPAPPAWQYLYAMPHIACRASRNDGQ